MRSPPYCDELHRTAAEYTAVDAGKNTEIVAWRTCGSPRVWEGWGEKLDGDRVVLIGDLKSGEDQYSFNDFWFSKIEVVR
jgi:hypothetical protein